MKAPTRIPVAIQGDPWTAREIYEIEIAGSAIVPREEPTPIYPVRARVKLREYSLMTPVGGVTWRFPESIEILEHGKAPAVFGFELSMIPPAVVEDPETGE